jgi:MoaA/NifB/PqqE/SkfB family radical SAM enzyme
MRYDVEADWHLLNTCNYRCSYCFFSPDVLGEKLAVHASPETWTRAFDRTGLTWLIHLTGGEPTAYPDFAELCQLLTEKHYLSFNSNLTQNSLIDFANRVDPARVNFINAGLHIEERQRRNGLQKFLDHVGYLQERKFPVFVSVVGTPEVLAEVDDVVAPTEPLGFVPVPKLMRGTYKGRNYPDAYTSSERAAFVALAAKARKSYGPRIDVRKERPTIDVFGDQQHVEGMPWFRGRRSSAGQKFVSLHPDGTVYRCETKQSNLLGNILDGSLRLQVEKSICDSDYCFYFCLKYADPPRVSLSSSFLRNTRAWRKIRKSPAWRALRGYGGCRAGEQR